MTGVMQRQRAASHRWRSAKILCRSHGICNRKAWFATGKKGYGPRQEPRRALTAGLSRSYRLEVSLRSSLIEFPKASATSMPLVAWGCCLT